MMPRLRKNKAKQPMVRIVHEMARVMNAVLRIRASIRWHVILFLTDLRSLGNGIGDDHVDIRS